MSQVAEKSATLYRMMMPSHTCPYGLKAMDLLSRHGYKVDDRHLVTREMTDAFKAEHDVRTTPQIWLGDEHVGGFDALKVRLGYALVEDPVPVAVEGRAAGQLAGVEDAVGVAVGLGAIGDLALVRDAVVVDFKLHVYKILKEKIKKIIN